MRYLAPENRMIDPISGYPFEGWNQDPAKGLYPPLLHPVDRHRPVHGAAREHRRRHMRHALPLPQAGPAQTWLTWSRACGRISATRSSAPGICWETSWTWPPASGSAPWPWTSRSTSFLAAFGRDKGEAIWKALQAKGWIIPRSNDREADIQRSAKYGWDHFDGPLAPFQRRRHEAEDHGHPRPARGHGRVHRQRQPFRRRRQDDRCASAARRSRTSRRSPELRASWNAFSRISSKAMPGSTTPRSASFTSAGTPPRTATSAGRTCRGNGSRATWITWSTSSAARPRSSSCGSACPWTPSRTWASR